MLVATSDLAGSSPRINFTTTHYYTNSIFRSSQAPNAMKDKYIPVLDDFGKLLLISSALFKLVGKLVGRSPFSKLSPLVVLVVLVVGLVVVVVDTGSLDG